MKVCQEYLALLRLEITKILMYQFTANCFSLPVLNSLGVRAEKANSWAETHVSSRRVNEMRDRKGEEVLPAGVGGWNIRIMECRLEGILGYPGACIKRC